MYLSTTTYLNDLIANQSLEYGRNVEEIRYSQVKSITPWQPTEYLIPAAVFGHIKGVTS